MSLAAVAAGADGLMVEVHPNPPTALSDKDQALAPAQFASLVKKVRSLAIFMEEIQ
jgi:3-deoxy-7-phosphoheptulonate synthase